MPNAINDGNKHYDYLTRRPCIDTHRRMDERGVVRGVHQNLYDNGFKVA